MNYPPPPTKFGAPGAGQAKAPGHARVGHAPPPTKFGAGAAQAKLAPPPRGQAPPPTRFGVAGAAQAAGSLPVSGGQAIQPYVVLRGDRIYTNAPAKRPWTGYPYAVVKAGDLQAQERRAQVGGEGAFLDRQGDANLRPRLGGIALRVSDDYQMAIENSDLGNRQPKNFFLTGALLTASNLALTNAGAAVQLVASGGTISILTGWWGTVTLQRVTASYTGHGSPDDLPQNCNLIAEAVTGRHGAQGQGNTAVTAARRALYGGTGNPSLDELRGYVRDYGDASTRTNAFPGQRNLNQFANPGIGDAYMIATQEPFSEYDEFTAMRPVTEEEWARYNVLVKKFSKPSSGRKKILDVESGRTRTLGWSFHFAGVVASSGDDRVTLENYARGDDRRGGGDPRWYFQMYSQSTSGQTFHEAHKAQNAYANPLTLTIRG